MQRKSVLVCCPCVQFTLLTKAQTGPHFQIGISTLPHAPREYCCGEEYAMFVTNLLETLRSRQLFLPARHDPSLSCSCPHLSLRTHHQRPHLHCHRYLHETCSASWRGRWRTSRHCFRILDPWVHLGRFHCWAGMVRPDLKGFGFSRVGDRGAVISTSNVKPGPSPKSAPSSSSSSFSSFCAALA